MAAKKDVADAVVVKHRDILHGFRYLPFGIGHFDLGIRKPVLVAGVIVEIAAVAPLKHFGNPRLAGNLLGDGDAVGSCMEQTVERLALYLQRDIHEVGLAGLLVAAQTVDGGDLTLGGLFYSRHERVFHVDEPGLAVKDGCPDDHVIRLLVDEWRDDGRDSPVCPAVEAQAVEGGLGDIDDFSEFAADIVFLALTTAFEGGMVECGVDDAAFDGRTDHGSGLMGLAVGTV